MITLVDELECDDMPNRGLRYSHDGVQREGAVEVMIGKLFSELPLRAPNSPSTAKIPVGADLHAGWNTRARELETEVAPAHASDLLDMGQPASASA